MCGGNILLATPGPYCWEPGTTEEEEEEGEGPVAKDPPLSDFLALEEFLKVFPAGSMVSFGGYMEEFSLSPDPEELEEGT